MDTVNDTLSTLQEDTDPLQIKTAYMITIPIISFLIVSGNLCTINAFLKLPSIIHDAPSEMLILSLSCADLITGLFAIPLYSPNWITGHWPLREVTCRIWGFLMDTVIIATLFTLCQISLDRFLLVLKEYPQYMKIQSRRRLQITVAVIWCLSLSVAAIEIDIWDVAKMLDESASLIDYSKDCLSPARRVKWFSLTLFWAIYFLPILLVCALSTAFFYLLRKRLAKSWGMRAGSKLSRPNGGGQSRKQSSSPSYYQQQKKQYIKPAATLLVLVSAMAVCMLPYCVYVIAMEAGCRQCADYDVLYVLLLLQFCNAGLDPFFYVMTQRQIQRFYKDRLTKLLLGRGHSVKQKNKQITTISRSHVST